MSSIVLTPVTWSWQSNSGCSAHCHQCPEQVELAAHSCSCLDPQPSAAGPVPQHRTTSRTWGHTMKLEGWQLELLMAARILRGAAGMERPVKPCVRCWASLDPHDSSDRGLR